MNILYCGDSNIIDGLIISVLSLAENTKEDLNIYVFTMDYSDEKRQFKALSSETISKLNVEVKKIRDNINIKLLNITDVAMQNLPIANLSTRFTPFCMLRLYADQIEELPNKILYLDNDVVALRDPKAFYDLDITDYDLAGVLDNYGSHFFKRKINYKDYLNSGVLLLNLENIRKHEVFLMSRNRCRKVVMLMPDQTALNMYAKKK
ncbi:MAG: glycosyltransferase, partial [bacterium]|nr:glycosyltransferase [bacterium]